MPAPADPRRDPLEQLEAEARHTRSKLDLYRQKAYGPRPTSQARLQQLEREALSAANRLQAARAAAAAADAAPD